MSDYMSEKKCIEVDEEKASSVIAFIKRHEPEEIPDDVWEFCCYLADEFDTW